MHWSTRLFVPGHALQHLVQTGQHVARGQIVGLFSVDPPEQHQNVGQVIRQLAGLRDVHQPQLLSELDQQRTPGIVLAVDVPADFERTNRINSKKAHGPL